MDIHALAVLAAAESWNWPPVKYIQQSGEQSITPKILSAFIQESQAYPHSQLVDQFWFNIQRGHMDLETNIKRLKTLPATSVSQEEILEILFERIDRKEVDFTFVFDFATKLLTHLGIAFQYYRAPTLGLERPLWPLWHPDVSDSEGETPYYSVMEFISKNPDELLKEAAEEGDEIRKQEIFKALLYKRDGVRCLLTDALYDLRDPQECRPILSHIIPNAVRDKPETLKFIAMLAGTKVRDLVEKHINGIGNITNLQSDASITYDDLWWAIEAKEDEGDGKVTYVYRRFADKNLPGPGFIKLRDGDEIRFGQGKGKDFEGFPRGPLPALCNLHYGVACVSSMSGAVHMIVRLYGSDTSDFPIDLTPTDFANILTSKLLNLGTFPPLNGGEN